MSNIQAEKKEGGVKNFFNNLLGSSKKEAEQPMKPSARKGAAKKKKEVMKEEVMKEEKMPEYDSDEDEMQIKAYMMEKNDLFD